MHSREHVGRVVRLLGWTILGSVVVAVGLAASDLLLHMDESHELSPEAIREIEALNAYQHEFSGLFREMTAQRPPLENPESIGFVRRCETSVFGRVNDCRARLLRNGPSIRMQDSLLRTSDALAALAMSPYDDRTRLRAERELNSMSRAMDTRIAALGGDVSSTARSTSR